MPEAHFRTGDLDPVDYVNFPPQLKRLLVIDMTLMITTGIWMVIAVVLIKFR